MWAHRIEKRLPFGFVGDWGKLYKKYTFVNTVEIKPGELITYEQNNYRDIGMDVQFKRASETTEGTEQGLKGEVRRVQYTTALTTDAYFDDFSREYMCIVKVGDVIDVFGFRWVCTNIKTTSKHTPAEQKFFYCDLKSIR